MIACAQTQKLSKARIVSERFRKERRFERMQPIRALDDGDHHHPNTMRQLKMLVAARMTTKNVDNSQPRSRGQNITSPLFVRTKQNNCVENCQHHSRPRPFVCIARERLWGVVHRRNVCLHSRRQRVDTHWPIIR